MTYNGWANYQTWNVALWIKNDEPLYRAAVEYKRNSLFPSYATFIKRMDAPNHVTPDGVSWTDPTLDHAALDEMIKELTE